MTGRVSIRYGTFAGHSGEVVSQDGDQVVVRVRVTVDRDEVELAADVIPRLRREIEAAHERWRKEERLAYFLDDTDWDGYVAHVGAVEALVARRTSEALERFDGESAAWSVERLAAAQRDADGAVGPYLPPQVLPAGEARDRAQQRRLAARDAAFERDYAAWRVDHPAPAAAALVAAREVVARRRPAIEERVRRDWGFELPDGIFRFEELRRIAGDALYESLDLRPMGLLDLFDDPARQARDGLDVRLHGRYHRDPPEFLTYLHGGTDGLHWGLWFDDGRSCTGVGHYYNNDGGGIGFPGDTPIEAVRERLEMHDASLRDLAIGHDYANQSERYDPALVGELFALRALREVVTMFETGDRPETGRDYQEAYWSSLPPPGRASTLDGAGASVVEVDGRHDCYDRSADTRWQLRYDPDAVRAYAEEARRRCADGDSSAALILGRDLHWVGGDDPERGRIAREMLVLAYRALGRDPLAGIADLHHRHRDLPQVGILDPA